VRRGVDQVRALRAKGDDHRAWLVLRSLFNLYQQDPACQILIMGCRAELWPDTPADQFEANFWPEQTPGHSAVIISPPVVISPPVDPNTAPAEASPDASVDPGPPDQ
jgi:hypothetical protein